MARTGFGLGGPGAVTTRPAEADQVVSGSTWAHDNIGYPVDATWVNRVRANLEALVTGLGGSLSDGDNQLINALTTALALKAPLASPALTGTPTAPTAAPGTNSTQLATTAYVIAVRDALLNAAPGVLDTLDELAAALGDDANFAATVTTALAGKQPLDADLTAIAGISPTKGRMLVGDGTTWQPIGVGSDGQSPVADSSEALGVKWATPSGGGTNPNIVINGDFQINQRVFAGGALSAGAYGFDRWKADTGGADVSVSGYVVTLTSGTIVQVIESALWGVANLASTDVTISVDAPSADLTVTLGSVSGTITAGSGRRSVTLTTGAGDTGNLAFKIAKAIGSGVTFGRVKAETGSSATAWQARTAVAELELCQRYFEKSMALATAPADGVSYQQNGFISSGGAVNTSQLYSPFIAFKVRKRAQPTFTPYRTTLGASAGKWAYLTSAWTSVDTVGTPTIAEVGFVVQVTVTAAPFTTGLSYGLSGAWTAECEL